MKMLDLCGQYAAYRDELDSAINGVIASGVFIGGGEISALEAELASFCNAPHVVGCSSGTDALLLALMAAGVKPGDEVITSPFTFIASAEAPCYLGAVPKFVDVHPETYLMDESKIEAAITSKTKAIMPVSLFGMPCDHAAIKEIAARHCLVVIEDAAQSFGGERGGMSGNLSELACTSFFPAKPLGCYGDGGAVFAQSSEHAQTMRQLLNHGSAERYHHDIVGMNARLDALQAAILRVKLRHFKEEKNKRIALAEHYDVEIKHDDVQLPVIPEGVVSVYAQYCPRTSSASVRDRLFAHFQKNGIPYAIYYPIPLHLQKAFARFNYKQGDFPVSEDLANRIFALPLHPFLSSRDQDHVIDTINSFTQ